MKENIFETIKRIDDNGKEGSFVAVSPKDFKEIPRSDGLYIGIAEDPDILVYNFVHKSAYQD